MRHLIQLQFIAAPENWIGNLCSKDSSKIKVLGMKLDDSQQNVTHLVEINSDKTSAADLKNELRRSNNITESDLASLDTNRLLGAVTSNNCRVGLVLLKSNRKTGPIGIGAAVTKNDCQISYKLYIRGEDIPEFFQFLHEGGVTYAISEFEKMSAPNALTAKQKHVLKSALEEGYYDNPKRISTEELSKKMGMSARTVSETLRIVQRKIISGHSEKAISIRNL